MLRCQCPSVCPSVRLSVTEVYWRIIANLGFKFRSKFTAHCGRGACGRAQGKGSSPGRVEGSSRAMLATARPSCLFYIISYSGLLTMPVASIAVKCKATVWCLSVCLSVNLASFVTLLRYAASVRLFPSTRGPIHFV